MFSLESLIEAILISTHNIPFLKVKNKMALTDSKSATMGFFSKGLKKEFETAMVNKPSGFEQLKFCCCMFINRLCLCLVSAKSALSVEEQRLLESLDRLNDKLKSKFRLKCVQSSYQSFRTILTIVCMAV